LAQNDTFIPAIIFGGFETIFTNDTSFIDEIDSHGANIYVASEGEIREVQESPFQINYRPRYFLQAHRFIDFRAFDDTANPPNTWIFGPTTARDVYGDFWVNHPVQLATVASNDTEVIPSFLFGAVTVRAIQTTTVAYLAGWEVSSGVANFAVVSATLNPSVVSQQTGTFATVVGTAVLYNGSYSDFSRTYKPRIFRSHTQPYIIVVDPVSRAVYKVTTDDTNYSLTFGTSSVFPIPGHVAGSVFDSDSGRLFVGTHARGTLPASIIVINTDTLTLNMTINLRNGESYPKAIDIRGNTLYVGINGGHSIAQIDVSVVNGTIKYSTLPWYLREIYSLTATRDGYIYFATYEQRAKVARVRLNDFCPSVCDTNFGYCQAPDLTSVGQCQCIPGYVLNVDGFHCDQNATVIEDITQNSLYKRAHAGNVALGLLFAAAFIAAAAGWFLLWRHKKGGDNKRYGAVGGHHEEHENFLGSDE